MGPERQSRLVIMRSLHTTRELMTTLARLRTSAVPVLLATSLFALLACDAVKNPLDVEASSRIPAENVEVPANSQLLVDGTVADFECALASYIVQGGEVGEEFVYAFQTADRVPPDQRTSSANDARYATSACTAFGIYGPLQTARSSGASRFRGRSLSLSRCARKGMMGS